MPDTDKTLIKTLRHLLWVRVRHPSDGSIRVFTYQSPEKLDKNRTLSDTFLSNAFKLAFSKRWKWKSQQSSTDRIIAQITESSTKSFTIHYYSIGIEMPKQKSRDPKEERLVSYFILDTEGRQPELPGNFDWQAPLPAKSMAEYFELKEGSPEGDRWDNSKMSFKAVFRFRIVRRLRVRNQEHIGLDVTSELRDYPRGRLIGGLPFGAEDKFLAICKIDKDDPDTWASVLEKHRDLFRAWNVICRKRSELKRIFVMGAPGSGKELWVDAIKEGSRPHRSGDWKTLSATLPTKDLKSILYGERSGALERPGFLASCAEGGVFIDEIGKSHPEFRRDLLRVLEAGEFVPLGGLPTSTRNVLFVFASTPTDRKNAYDPPDFWTRMDVELPLPTPITLMPRGARVSQSSPFNKCDEARFHALLAAFWLDALEEQLGDTSVDPDALLKNFTEKVFNPIVSRLAEVSLKQPWPRKCAKGIPVSPRRVKSLATTLASEWQWIGYEPEARASSNAQDDYQKFMEQFVATFFTQLREDEENRASADEEAEKARKHGRLDGMAHDEP